MVAVVWAAIAEEAVNAPPVVIVPSAVGLTDQETTWLGVSCPATVAVKETLFPAVTVPVDGATVTEVAVVVVEPLLLPLGLFPPQPLKEMKAPPRQIPSAIDKTKRHCLLGIGFSF